MAALLAAIPSYFSPAGFDGDADADDQHQSEEEDDDGNANGSGNGFGGNVFIDNLFIIMHIHR